MKECLKESSLGINLQILDDLAEPTAEDMDDNDDGASDASYSTRDDKPVPGDKDEPETDHVEESQSMFFGNRGIMRELDEEVSLTEDKKGDTKSNTNTNTVDDDDTKKEGVTMEDDTPKELKSNLDGSYWKTSNAHVAYSLTAISEFGQIDASLATPQYGFSKGLKIFGNAGYQATVSELKDNLTNRGVVQMEEATAINHDMFNKSLKYLIYLKQKRCGKIKARGCADGRPQREYITKEESSSPTVATNALLAMCLICAIEEHEIAVCDIPGAYLTAYWSDDQDCWIRFDGVIADMLLEINPQYRSCVKIFQNGNRVMYGKLKKVIYGTLLGGLLFYNKLRKILEEMEFKVNP